MGSLEAMPDDIVRDFFLRLPPEDPVCLLRVATVCKRWLRILADPEFVSRHRALHHPVLGFIHVVSDVLPYRSRFVPINASPDSLLPAVRELPDWLVLDCRHGRALFVTPATGPGKAEATLDFIIWDPSTNRKILLPQPDLPPINYRLNFSAAVLCAADKEGVDHLDCHRGHFHVVFVRSLPFDPQGDCHTCASVYSSATGSWSNLTSFLSKASVDVRPCSSALGGGAMYFRGVHDRAFRCQFSDQRLSVIERPPRAMFRGHRILLMSPPQGGGLGFAGVEEVPNICLSLWSRVAQWAQDRTIDLEILLPEAAFQNPTDAVVVGIAEGTDVVFVTVQFDDGPRDIYMIKYNSRSAEKVLEDQQAISVIFPYATYCVPVVDTRQNAGN